MWRKLKGKDLENYYKKWINGTLKIAVTKDPVKKHIKKHITEIDDSDPEQWAASMRTLLDIFEAVYKIEPSLKLQLKKMENHYKRHPKRACPPPKTIKIQLIS